MSAKATLLKLQELGFDTGLLRVYWDFTSYEDIGGDICVSNDELLDERYVGVLEAPSDGVDYFTGVEGTGRFAGGISGLYTAPTLSFLSGISAANFTCFFAGGIKEQDGHTEEFGPVQVDGCVFSCSEGVCGTGFEFGLNSLNTAFFSQDDGAKRVITATGMPMARNLWAVSYDGQELLLGRYNTKTEVFDLVREQLRVNPTGEQSWYLGYGAETSAIYSANKQDGDQSSAEDFYGQLSRFVWINTGLSEGRLNEIAPCLFKTVGHYMSSNPLNQSDFYDSVTGYSGVDETGVIGVSISLGATTGTEWVYWTGAVELTGNVSVGEIYYLVDSYATGEGYEFMYGPLPLYSTNYNGGEVSTGITGFSLVEISGLVTLLPEDSASFEAETGVIGSGASPYTESGGLLSLASVEGWTVSQPWIPADMYPDSATYIGPKRTDAYTGYEVYAITGDVDSHNKIAKVRLSSYFPSLTHILDQTYAASGINFFLNRLAQTQAFEIDTLVEYVPPVLVPTTGAEYIMYSCEGDQVVEYTGYTQVVDESSRASYIISGYDYFLTGRQLMYSRRYSSDGQFDGLHDVGYEAFGLSTTGSCAGAVIVSPLELRLVVNTADIAEYGGTITSDPVQFGDVFDGNPSYANCVTGFDESLVFLNGYKLRSGVDYTLTNGEFVALDIVGGSGVISFFPMLRGTNHQGDSVCAPNFSGLATSVGSLVVFVGGERIMPEDVFYHSSNHDMVFDPEIQSKHYWFTVDGLEET